MGGGDTHGTLFGSTRNAYDLERTVGGSSGGSGVGVSCNFGAIAVGQESFSSIRRPAAWNSVVGMRPTPGLVSRGGVYAGWPSRTGSLGPLTRTVQDLATLLDVMVGYDPEDPMTAHGVGHVPATYTASLDPNGLKGVRLGILRTSMGNSAEPDSEDFAKVTALFDRAIEDLGRAGATLVDPIVIPNLNELLAKRAGEGNDGSFEVWMNRSKNPPFKSAAEMREAPGYPQYSARRGGGPVRAGGDGTSSNPAWEYAKARDELMTNILRVMADNQLDAIVHKSVEHQPTLIEQGVNPPYISSKGAAHLNTFLIYAASISVPAGFTTDGLPNGITFFGRPYSEPSLIKYAYAYEQATHNRVPPKTTPALAGE
jgi:Asp-tRNA(Asn)/Glu-tRNA(Gln) amidotransferase A subunit family amidase